MLLEGLHIPLTTPFHPDGRLNLHKLAANVARYSKTPAAGLIVLGPSGEPTLLSDDETREVLRTAAESAAPEKVLIAGIARDSVSATLALADFAAELHYDAILVAAPSFLVPEAGLARLDANHRPIPLHRTWFLALQTFFQTVADHSPLPVVPLTVPGRTLGLKSARKASTHPNVIGLCIERASTDVQRAVIASVLDETAGIKRDVAVTPTFAAVTARMKLAAAVQLAPSLISTSTLTGKSSAAVVEPAPSAPPPALRTRTKSVGFQIVAAHTLDLLDVLNAGAVGIAPAFAACAPQAGYEVYAAWKDAALSRDASAAPLAEEKQARLREAAALAESLGPGGLKYACDLNGYYGGPPRLPHLPITGAQRSELEQIMKPLRN